jgi:sec-independent protein translocase protein TatA
LALVIVALVILVLFGRGKISEMMGDFGKGVSSFKKGLAEADDMTTPRRRSRPRRAALRRPGAAAEVRGGERSATRRGIFHIAAILLACEVRIGSALR